MRAFFEVIAPAADGHVVAAGHNKRLLPAAFPCCWVLPAPLVAAHPLYSLRCSGILIRASAAGWAAAEARPLFRPFQPFRSRPLVFF